MARPLSCHYDERQNQALLSDPRATLDRIEARCSNPVCLEQVVNGERIMSNFCLPSSQYSSIVCDCTLPSRRECGVQLTTP